MSALVTNAEMLMALSVTTSLGKKGVEVTCGSQNDSALSFHSRYCHKRVVYPSPLDEAEFIGHLERVLVREKVDVVIPTFADTLLTISRHRERLAKYAKIPIAENDKVEKALDKSETIRIAIENDIPCPKTIILNQKEDIDAVKDKLEYPLVLKPRKCFGAKGVAYLRTPEELVFEYGRISSKYGKSLLLQEMIPLEGDVFGCEALFNADSKPRAVFIHKRLRQYPLTGGQSTLRESVRHPEVERLGLKLLKELGWYGVAMVEFKIDTRDQKPKLMEINPRFWGSLHLPMASGVDFPHLLYKLALDGDISPVTEYRLGVKSRTLLPGDLRYLMSALRDDFTKLGLKRQDRMRVLMDFLRFYEKDLHYELFSLDDPKPGLFEVWRTFSQKIRKRIPGLT
jgi:predicted ATP-grasp superfamily ATP-dependent carboligase